MPQTTAQHTMKKHHHHHLQRNGRPIKPAAPRRKITQYTHTHINTIYFNSMEKSIMNETKSKVCKTMFHNIKQNKSIQNQDSN